MNRTTAANSKVPAVTLVLIALILAVFALGAFKVERQAQQISEIIDAQSPLIFSFENVGQNGQPKVTFVVTCNLAEDGSRYICRSETPLTTPTPTATPTPVK